MGLEFVVWMRFFKLVPVGFFTAVNFSVAGVAWAVPSSSNCGSGDAPITLPSPANNVNLCNFVSAPSVPASGWVCDLRSVCSNVDSTAKIIYYSGDQWVAWVDCGSNGSIDDCEVLPRTESGGVPETEALYLSGGSGDDTLAFEHASTYNLQPIPSYSELIVGYAHGLDGFDHLYGSSQVSSYLEYLYGGDDVDDILGKDGDDYLYGGADNDVLLGGNGNDRIEGGAGNDNIGAGPGNDIIYGGAGYDLIAGGDHDDKIDPGSDNDTVCGDNNGGSWLSFYCLDGIDDGKDEIRESAGNDLIWGQNGIDKICDSDADELYAGDGDDIVFHDGAFSVFDCGLGTDTVNVTGGTSCDVISLNACPYMSW
jgi:hypothetical protein